MVEIAAALHKLATYRTHNNRASQETFSKGIIILKNNIANNIGEDGASYFVVSLGSKRNIFRRLGFLGTTGSGCNRCWQIGRR